MTPPNWYTRVNDAHPMDETTQYIPPPTTPSIGAQVTAKVQNVDLLSRQNDALSGALRVACDMLEAAGLGAYPFQFDALLVELGGRVNMERGDLFYEVTARRNTMGS